MRDHFGDETRCSQFMGYTFWLAAKGGFIFTIPLTGEHIPQPLLHQSWSTGWNENKLNGSTMRDRSDDPLHHEGCSTTELCLAEIGRKEMFYLTTHSTHFIYGYMVSDIW